MNFPKLDRAFLALLCFFGNGLTAAVDLTAHQRCLDELAIVDARVTRFLTPNLITFDRRLVRLREGVVYQAANFRILDAQRERGDLDPQLAGNAELSCREFVDAYSSRAFWFVALLVCNAILVALLTLRGALSIFRRRKSKGASDVTSTVSVAPRPPIAPTDQ